MTDVARWIALGARGRLLAKRSTGGWGVFVGLRCTADGVLGCYADWKIDYSPTSHLLSQV